VKRPRSAGILASGTDRRLGRAPFALQRALELQAAFQVFYADCTVNHPTRVRERITAMHPQELHAAVGKILLYIPSRRRA